MAGQPIASQWHRRTFLKGAGLGVLAASGLTALQPLGPESWAAGERTRFVSTWNAPDILDPHVKYDVGAAAFNLNLYDNLLRYKGIRLSSFPGWQKRMRSRTVVGSGPSTCDGMPRFMTVVR